MSTNNISNKTNETNGEETVIETQPKSNKTEEQKQKLSSTEELALLGLRPKYLKQLIIDFLKFVFKQNTKN